MESLTVIPSVDYVPYTYIEVHYMSLIIMAYYPSGDGNDNLTNSWTQLVRYLLMAWSPACSYNFNLSPLKIFFICQESDWD